jgi:hypothetical protein
MNILIKTDDFSIENLFFLERKKNVIIDGTFSKIIYSDNLFIMNGLFFEFPLQLNVETAQHVFNKQCVYFNSHLQKNLLCITKISEIENSILNYYKKANGLDKKNNLLLTTQLYNGFFKIYKDNTHASNNGTKKYILKISGLWETRNEIGITYKFAEVTEPFMNTFP